MDDLISRAYVLAEYDRQHKGPPGGARKIMEEAPAVDAVPVEWLRNIILTCDDEESKAAYMLLHKWNDEHFDIDGKPSKNELVSDHYKLNYPKCPNCGVKMDGDT